MSDTETMAREGYKHDPMYGAHPNSLLERIKYEDRDLYKKITRWLSDVKRDGEYVERWARDGFTSRPGGKGV
jgi:hypothetical protein